ncbi:MAG: VWA domain-containing protein [Trueperaceae bacterium]
MPQLLPSSSACAVAIRTAYIVGHARRLALTALLSVLAVAGAQECTYESEPNDTPAQATRITGVGPDAQGLRRDGVGIACFTGELGAGDQDAFVWEVGEPEAGKRWVLEVEGVRGQLTKVDVIRVSFAANGVDVTAAETLFTAGTADGTWTTSPEFLIGPGRYVLGVSSSGGSGAYVAHLRPVEEVRYRAEVYREGREVEVPFQLFGTVIGQLEQPFVIPEGAAGSAWGLSLRASVGDRPVLTLDGPAGTVVEAKVDASGEARVDALGLEPGGYVARVEGDVGVALLRLEQQGRIGDGREVEPNDTRDTATRFPPGSEMRGTMENRDFFRIDVGEADAAGAWDLVVDATNEVTLRLTDGQGTVRQDRRGTSGTMAALHLDVGTYFLEVNGANGTSYTLALRAVPAAGPEQEREPNDTLAAAGELGPEMRVRGAFAPQDEDIYLLRVEGEAQRFRLQVVGAGVEELRLLDRSGDELARVRGERRIRLDDVVLLPGPYYLEVAGTEGEYALQALSLGAAPAPEPTAEAPAADEVLVPAETPLPESSPEDAAADLAFSAAPAGPPPPPGLLEVEPNDDASRAVRLESGVVHVGRLASEEDVDYYRFHLADDQFVRIELVPPAGGVSIPMYFRGTGWYEVLEQEEGAPTVLERWFLAGDHELEVRGSGPRSGPPTGYYQIRLTPLGALRLPVDLEPNDDRDTASRIPADLAWEGVVGDQGSANDVYHLPSFAQETELEVRVTGEPRPSVEVLLASGAARGRDEEGVLRYTLPAGEPTWLRVSGRTRYGLELAFSHPPDAADLLPPRADGVIEVTLDADVEELAAFWHEGQAFRATAQVRNLGDTAQTVRLAAATSDATAHAAVPEEVRLGPGESADVPVDVTVPADMRDDLPLRIEVAAFGDTGSSAAAFTPALRCEAPPVGAFAYQPLPPELLGRIDALWSGLGARVHGESGHLQRDETLIDGRTSPSNGAYLGEDHSPTFVLSGDAPLRLVGATLHPQSNVDTERQLKRFRIETSMDGSTFTPVLESDLKAARVEQAFVFDAPVTARYARLVFVSNQTGGRDAYLGEWKLLAEDPAAFDQPNLAAVELGGHVVWADPVLNGRYSNAVLTPEPDVYQIDTRDSGGLTFVVGFQHDRAAQITTLEWIESEDAAESPESMFASVQVDVSTTGPAGPWEPLADWTLERDANGRAVLTLGEPVWARYLKVHAGPSDEERYSFPPEQFRVLERPVGEGYLSALGEWGHVSRSAVYEYLRTGSDDAVVEDADGGETQATATPLAPGSVIQGSVQVAEDVDWYRMTLPEGENHLEIRLSGDPAIGYRYDLVDAEGRSAPYETREEGDTVVLTLYADPGDYFLRLEEPKRTVVFSWDTSGSVRPYQPITYASLAGFARDVNGEREAVQLLAFDDPSPKWLLPIWSTDAQRVQRSIAEFDRSSDSSNSIIALLTATKALADRDGTRAILLMTDAETGGEELLPELWRAFEQVRPRVFTFEISSAGSDYAQDLMQDWADVNAGVYDLAAGVGDFDAGFARASCVLRRPKRYRIEVTTSYQAPPGPGSLSVTRAAGAAQPAVEVVFDASGSMGRELPSGEQRITAAKRVLESLVGEVLPEGAPFALRAFGHVTPSSCETRLDVPLAPLDRAEALAAVRAIEPKLLSQTPLAESLALVAEDLAAAGGTRTVILITDGEESCGGDPAAAVRGLRDQGIDIDLAIVSLALEPESQAVFEALAESVGASYVDVTSFEELQASVEEALNPAFEVLDASGAVVARGRVGGAPIELEMGVYTVRVMTTPVEEFRDVRVPGERSVLLTVGGR